MDYIQSTKFEVQGTPPEFREIDGLSYPIGNFRQLSNIRKNTNYINSIYRA